MLPIENYLFLSLALFIIGVIGVVTRRNVIVVLMSIELILNAVNINLVAFSRLYSDVAGQRVSRALHVSMCAVAPEHRVGQQIMFEWLTPGPMQMTGGHVIRFVADWGFLLDPLSCVMVLVVTGVGFLIHVYSVGYMAHEGGYYRFFGYMNLFMFAMLTLVLPNSILLLFFGWQVVAP